MSQPAIRAVGLTKRFGSVAALRELDLDPAGRGVRLPRTQRGRQDTTIRLLLDFIRPTSGHIQVLGATGADPEVRRRIGYLPAELPIDPRWTAQDLLDSTAACAAASTPAGSGNCWAASTSTRPGESES